MVFDGLRCFGAWKWWWEMMTQCIKCKKKTRHQLNWRLKWWVAPENWWSSLKSHWTNISSRLLKSYQMIYDHIKSLYIYIYVYIFAGVCGYGWALYASLRLPTHGPMTEKPALRRSGSAMRFWEEIPGWPPEENHPMKKGLMAVSMLVFHGVFMI